ncbi:MAG: peptidase S24 [Clostridiaceae bacterium]|nr:peptidase S24 [Clostridiaceae bacterium]
MCELKKVRAAELFSLVDEILGNGERAWITVTGMSMYPFLREGRDSIELSSVTYDTVKKGDIVLIRRKTGQYVLHRLLKKERDQFYIIGDAQQWVEGPLNPGQLLAYVTRIKRGKQTIICNNIIHRCAAGIWLALIPYRNKVIRICIRI